MELNRKIKKLEKINKTSTSRFKKSNAKLERAKSGTIRFPCQHLDQSQVYMMESDITFGVKDGKVLIGGPMLSLFKHVTSVEVRKDLSEKIITFKLDSQPYPEIMSWRKVVEILSQDESPAIKEWTKLVREFGSQYEKFIKEFGKFIKETPLEKKILMREQSAYKRLTILSNYPAFEVRYRMRKNEIKNSELCFNESFIQEAGYTIDDFTSTLFMQGLPQLFPFDCPSINSVVQGYLKVLNYSSHETKISDLKTDLLMKNGQRKQVVFDTVILMELTETDLVISFILVLKMTSQPYGTYEKLPFSNEFAEKIKDNKKKKDAFFNTYYLNKSQHVPTVTQKVCKIKQVSFSEIDGSLK